jgi:hypothetical protein
MITLDEISEAIKKGKIIWRKHAVLRMIERKVSRENVLACLSNGLIINQYPDDKPFPSYLLLCFPNNEPIHIAFSYNHDNQFIYIITVYNPSLDYFEEDFITRRTR